MPFILQVLLCPTHYHLYFKSDAQLRKLKMTNQTVLVTGVSGYLGLHVAQTLLDRGYNVRGTVRNSTKEAPVREALRAKHGMLSFVECDLTSDQGWREAFIGVDAVIHVASPFILKEPKDEKEYLRPAVEGTLRVVQFAREAGVKKAVVTSTYLTMGGHLSSGSFGPDDFTPIDDPTINAYIRSKVAAEQALWGFVREQGKDMNVSTIHPGAILGPPLTKGDAGTSVSTISAMLAGSTPGIPPISVPMVDVRDVALAHVSALEFEGSANKRYVAAHPVPISYMEVARTLRSAGYSKVPGKEIPEKLIRILGIFNRELRSMKAFLGKSVHADNSRTVSELNWSPRPISETVLETAKAL
jgi:dihydroflavonol-4-reductase